MPVEKTGTLHFLWWAKGSRGAGTAGPAVLHTQIWSLSINIQVAIGAPAHTQWQYSTQGLKAALQR